MRAGLSGLTAVLASRKLRSLAFGFLVFNLADWGSWIAILVYAYGHGGSSASALVVVVQLVPASLIAPVVGALVDRHGAIRGLVFGYVVQAVSLALVAAGITFAAPVPVVFGASILYAIAFVITRPAQAAALPLLTRTPEELAATNVVNGWMETGGSFAGPALAGLVLSQNGAGAVFWVFAGLSAASVIPLFRHRHATTGADDDTASEVDGANESVLMTVWNGIQAARADQGPLQLAAILTAAWALIGLLDVVNVVLAVSVFHLGDGGPGYLGSLFGLGAFAGGAAAVLLIGRRNLVRPMLVAAVLSGAPLVLLAFHLTTGLAEVTLVFAGAGMAVTEVAGKTLLQRSVPAERLAAIFGLVEGAGLAAEALGAAAVPLLIRFGGVPLAVVGAAVALPVPALCGYRGLRKLERGTPARTSEVTLLRHAPLFAPLGAPALETLASSLRPRLAAAGTRVITQGEHGDAYYLIVTGTLAVSIDGVRVRALGPGDGFGEVALLHDVPRTATVTAIDDVALLVLEREPFIEALTGHRPSGTLIP